MKQDELETFYPNNDLSSMEDDSYFLTRLSNLWGEDCLSLYEDEDETEELSQEMSLSISD